MKSMKTQIIINACGLTIFSHFKLHWFISNLPFFERDPHMDSPEAIRGISISKAMKTPVIPFF